jgi:uncharacterized RDD family membrane protein YckC
MFCTKCGKMVAEGVAYCPDCGMSTGLLEMGGTEARPSRGAPAGWQGGGAPHVVYAGFWLRFVAHLIDHLLVGAPVALLIIGIALLAGFGAFFRGIRLPERGDVPPVLPLIFGGAFLMILFIAVVGGWLYYAVLESSSWQGTVGKKAIGLMVTDMAGARVTFGRASGRYFAKLVSGLIPFGIGYIMAGFTEKKQALHDMIASCLVIRRRAI